MANSTQIFSRVPPVIPSADSPKSPGERAKSDLWIFREGRREVSGPGKVRDLLRKLASKSFLLDFVMEAGELEAALADLNAGSADSAASLTDALPVKLCPGDYPQGMQTEQLE